MSEIEKDLDCYGLLYEPLISPCNNKCEVRFKCRAELKKRLEKEGAAELKRQQQLVITRNERATARSGEERKGLQPKLSTFVSEVIMILEKNGLKPVVRGEYMTFKLAHRSIFTLTRFQAESMDTLLKFVFLKRRRDLPTKLKPYVSERRKGRYFVCLAKDLEDLKNFLREYLPTLPGKR